MSNSLIMQDIDNFLNKYTRFMTKDIYISKEMYDKFLESYNYLYKYLEKNSILYRENPKYKKIFKIRERQKKLLKLHNQKYLKKNLDFYSQFFCNLKISDKLDNNQRGVILANEEKILFVSDKNIDSLIVGKVKYLIDILGISKNKILVLQDNNVKLDKVFSDNDIDGVGLVDINDYKELILDGRKIVSNSDKYNILFDYIINILYKDKNNFKKFYEGFANNIYLNKDYLDYDTFSDYHNYMYKRKFLSSNLSLDRFIGKEIEKRKKYLRTIKNELVNVIEEVDVSNYLCFKGITYKYIKDEKLFLIGEGDNSFKLKIAFNDKMELDFVYDNGVIYINIDSINDETYKERLEEIFRLKEIKIGECDEKEIYDILKNSMIDNYFSEFINKYLIKYLDYYEMNKSFDSININNEQVEVLREIYDYYKDYLKRNNFVTKGEVMSLLENDINSKNYKYIIINGDISLKLSGNILKIIDSYKEVELIRENIKLLYDYKKYLNDNKILALNDVYIDEVEISNLTSSFLKKNLNEINECFVNSDKKVSIYLYDDSNRLVVNKNIARACYRVVRSSCNIVIGVSSIKEISSLIYKDYFVKNNKKNLSIDGKNIIECEEILNLRKSYDKVILPFLIKDSYHEEKLINDNSYFVKLMIYVALNKCRDELILLVPSRKKKEVIKIFKGIKNISVFE